MDPAFIYAHPFFFIPEPPLSENRRPDGPSPTSLADDLRQTYLGRARNLREIAALSMDEQVKSSLEQRAGEWEKLAAAQESAR